MLFYSGSEKDVPLSEALFRGFASDGGLYLPQKLPSFSMDTFRGLDFLEIAQIVCAHFFPGLDLEPESLFDFPLPMHSFPDQTHVLELFHGPTLSFKDFGARLMARLVGLLRPDDTKVVVLVATSGDTGSALGQAFYGMPHVRVKILYPKGAITPSQERQIQTIGGNVQPFEIEGNFEACQELVRRACLDEELRSTQLVTTGNSINIGRLLGHTLYYFYAYSALGLQGEEALFSIPCGNFGHLVAGILAKRMGVPIARFIAATNANDEVPLFLHSGVFQPHPAHHTLSVSMDVGNPSNFPRLLELYDYSLEQMRHDLIGVSFTDEEVCQAIKQVDENFGYLLDPHSAIAYLGLKHYLEFEKGGHARIFFATAHPAKFSEAIEPVIGRSISCPPALQHLLTQPKAVTPCSSDYAAFKKELF